MKIEKKPINFKDKRGLIRDILIGKKIDAITLLTCKPGAIRGNHFHKKSIQYLYVINGRLLCASQIKDNPVEIKEITEGYLIINPIKEKHAFKALEESLLLCMTKGARKGMDYEKDTFRLKKLIL
jgi:quercetin dioxygenase-like cupin family protein